MVAIFNGKELNLHWINGLTARGPKIIFRESFELITLFIRTPISYSYPPSLPICLVKQRPPDSPSITSISISIRLDTKVYFHLPFASSRFQKHPPNRI